jgi:tetratricopeptide (TPR) repeat protein
MAELGSEMNNRCPRLGKSIIGAILIGLIPLGAIAQFPSLVLAQNLKNSEQPIKKAQNKPLKLTLAQNSTQQNYTQLAELVNSKDADYYYKRGVTRYINRNYSGAEADFTQALKLDPNDAYAYHNRGLVRYAVKNYSGAEADYTQAIKLNPEYDDAYNNRGLVRYAVKNYSGAEADYTQAIKINPDNAGAYYNRGLVRYAVKNYSGSKADYTQYIKINPNDADAYYNRNLLHRQ